jgi:hypothetical protein
MKANLASCESPPIWNSYQIMKQHFPSITASKDDIFTQLSLALPNSDPEIQSFDGLCIDVLWENLTVSITDFDTFSVTNGEEFNYFERLADFLTYISSVLVNENVFEK